MADFDYYSIMQKRIEYYAKKYDPYNRLTVKNELILQKSEEQKVKKIRQKISSGYSHVISILF
jgi:hypothetical protein